MSKTKSRNRTRLLDSIFPCMREESSEEEDEGEYEDKD